MKKTLCFLLIASLCACKSQTDVKPVANLSAGKSRTLFHGDGLYDVLGYGIDITKDELDPNSTSLSPILNVSQFATDYASQLSSYLSEDNTSTGTSNFYSGSTAIDYSTSLTQTKGLTASVNSGGTEKVEGASQGTNTGTATSSDLFTASFSKNSSDQTSNAYSSRYSYASAEVTQRVRRWAFTGNVTPAMLMNYLTPAFLSDVNTLSATDLVNRYGTHVLLDITLGGVLKFSYSTITTNETNTTNQTSDLKIGLGASISKVIGVNIGYSATSAQITTIQNSSQNTQTTMTYFGGNNSGQTVSIDKDGNASQSINYGSWTSSVSPTNAAVIGVDRALYLSDFISDPTKKAAVLTAIQNKIKAAQLALATDPIYEFYYTAGGCYDHFTTGDPNATVGYSNWASDGTHFKAFLGQAPGTVPVYIYYYSNNGDHYTDANPNAVKGYSGWSNFGISFYAYSTQVAGTVPVYLYYSTKGDHFTSADPTIPSKYAGWSNFGVIFYAFPN
jgi:hypothetical protein